jgi:hypothetical protein
MSARALHIELWVEGYKTYANDTLGADELDQLVLDRALGVTLAIGLKVAKITNMANRVDPVTVCGSVRVDCRRLSG